jgi:glycosyltransferase involved in cell wall biosynthesis
MSAAAEVVSDLQLMLESPAEGAIVDDEVTVSGWCLSRSGERCAVRLRSQEHSLELQTGSLRSDVAATFPDVGSAATSGFAGVLALPAGTHQVSIDVRVGRGEWQPLGVRSVVVRATPLRASLDTPSPMRAQAGPLRFSGWCVHPKYHIADLRLAVGGDRVACQFGLDRTDVGAAFPHAPGAARSGFEVSMNVRPGRWPVSLVAVLENGSEAVLEWPQPLLARNLPLPIRVARFFGFCFGALRYGWRLARTWLAENRRLPRPGEVPAMIRFAIERYRQLGHDPAQAGGPPGFSVPEPLDAYAAWQTFNGFSDAARRDLEQRLARAGALPRLSIVMPVYNAPLDLLAAAVDSVRAQVFGGWELCIADDGSTVDGIREYLTQLATEEPRVRVCLREENGNISRATNSAAELATGDFLVLLDQDDLLTPDALAEIALCIQARPDADIVYSDDDKIDSSGRRFAPQFKPDWSPELLLGYMYFSHVFVVRRELYAEVGGMRVGFEGSQDYDFALRATERARAIAHIPQVLYHWRVLPGSTAASGGEKPASFEAGRSAVEEALHRRGIHARALQPDWARKAKVGIFGIEFPDDGAKVSIIIPTRNGLEILRRCIDSLQQTTYRNYEVIIVDNDSDDAATIEYLKALPHRVERISNPHGRFNFAAINNRAAERAHGELLLFLNNDTEVIAPRWLSQMVGYAGFAGVGAVGARLLFADRRIQHAGIVHGYYRGLAGPAFKLAPEWDNGYLSYARVARNYSAVTAACMLTPRATFLELGGFDEVHFEVAYNDVDYCYRLGERGLRSVYCADAELLHHEGHSRGFFDRPQEIAAFRRKYANKRDPYYSPHLTLDHERFAIKPRRVRPETGRPVRALMCAFNLNWEGAPYSQLELTLGLRRGGHVEPVVYAPKDGPLRAAYEQAGITVHVFDHPLAGVFDEAAYDRALDRFGTFIGKLGVDVVYGNTLQTFYAIDAAHRLGVPCLWNPRESEPWQTYFNFLPAPLAARALRCFEYPYRVIFVAEATRSVWAPLESRGNFAVVHNGLDLTRLQAEAARYPRASAREELGIAASDVVFLLPGTVCERKGQLDLVNALAQLQPAETARMRCFIVGDRASSYSVELHRLVAALPEDLRQRVQIAPETHEIARYYQAADVFVCTSRIESFPRVVLEAMAYGLPVVSTRVFGIAEQVGENVNALLYDPGDASRLAAHLRHLIDDDAVRERLQANSPHVLATLNTFDEMVAAYATAFREAALTAPAPLAAGVDRPQTDSGG